MNPTRNPTNINTLMWPFAIHPVQFSAALTGGFTTVRVFIRSQMEPYWRIMMFSARQINILTKQKVSFIVCWCKGSQGDSPIGTGSGERC